MSKAFKRLVKIWTSTKKVMYIAKRIRGNTHKFITNKKKWHKQIKADKLKSFNEFLDKLSQGGMKNIWNYFNIFKRKKRKITVQLETNQIETFRQYWEKLYQERHSRIKFLSIKDHLFNIEEQTQDKIEVKWEDLQQVISGIDLNKAAWGQITPMVIKWGAEVCLS